MINKMLRKALQVSMEWVIEKHCDLFHTEEDHEPEEDEVVETWSIERLKRQWLYDFNIEKPERFAIDLGLPPYSEEGSQFERESSDARLKRIEPLLPLLQQQGEWLAEVLVHAGGVFSQDIPEHLRHSVQHSYEHLFFHNLTTLAATLAEMGLLRVDG